jgi:hypothetical protein
VERPQGGLALLRGCEKFLPQGLCRVPNGLYPLFVPLSMADYPMSQIHRKLTAYLESWKRSGFQLDLFLVAPQLVKLRDCRLIVPGQYDPAIAQDDQQFIRKIETHLDVLPVSDEACVRDIMLITAAAPVETIAKKTDNQ